MDWRETYVKPEELVGGYFQNLDEKCWKPKVDSGDKMQIII